MKKLKHEGELFKAALAAAMKYGVERGAVEFEPTDSASEKLLYVYRLLVTTKSFIPYLKIRFPRKQCGTNWPSGTRSNCQKTTLCWARD